MPESKDLNVLTRRNHSIGSRSRHFRSSLVSNSSFNFDTKDASSKFRGHAKHFKESDGNSFKENSCNSRSSVKMITAALLHRLKEARASAKKKTNKECQVSKEPGDKEMPFLEGDKFITISLFESKPKKSFRQDPN